MGHQYLADAGQIPHMSIDELLPTPQEKNVLAALGDKTPLAVSGARDDPEGALADLLAALETLGLIVDGTTAA